MTEGEAIERMWYRIKSATDIVGKGIDGKDYEDMEMAISALEEIQEYRKIGTVEECRAAVEKQKPKKPDIEGDGYADGKLVYDTYICPTCNKRYEIDYDDYDYCPNCGQHIDRSDWSDKDV